MEGGTGGEPAVVGGRSRFAGVDGTVATCNHKLVLQKGVVDPKQLTMASYDVASVALELAVPGMHAEAPHTRLPYLAVAVEEGMEAGEVLP